VFPVPPRPSLALFGPWQASNHMVTQVVDMESTRVTTFQSLRRNAVGESGGTIFTTVY
jgi:hypothetical protein